MKNIQSFIWGVLFMFLLFSCGSFECEERIKYRVIDEGINGYVCNKWIEPNKNLPTIDICNSKGEMVFYYKILDRDTLHSIFAKVDYGDSLYKAKGDSIVRIYWNGKLRGTYNVWGECARVSR